MIYLILLILVSNLFGGGVGGGSCPTPLESSYYNVLTCPPPPPPNPGGILHIKLWHCNILRNGVEQNYDFSRPSTGQINFCLK